MSVISRQTVQHLPYGGKYFKIKDLTGVNAWDISESLLAYSDAFENVRIFNLKTLSEVASFSVTSDPEILLFDGANIVYSDANDNIYVYDTSGTQQQNFSSGGVTSIDINGDWLAYNDTYIGVIYIKRLSDGTEVNNFSNSATDDIAVSEANDFVALADAGNLNFYTASTGTFLDGYSNGSIFYIDLSGNNVFASDSSDRVRVYDLTGTEVNNFDFAFNNLRDLSGFGSYLAVWEDDDSALYVVSDPAGTETTIRKFIDNLEAPADDKNTVTIDDRFLAMSNSAGDTIHVWADAYRTLPTEADLGAISP